MIWEFFWNIMITVIYSSICFEAAICSLIIFHSCYRDVTVIANNIYVSKLRLICISECNLCNYWLSFNMQAAPLLYRVKSRLVTLYNYQDRCSLTISNLLSWKFAFHYIWFWSACQATAVMHHWVLANHLLEWGNWPTVLLSNMCY